jgi:peptide-N4-(N-acetyl-beta-glucosaminyl)asparagine amidase
MHEIRKIRRENMDKSLRNQRMREDEREEKELRSYVAQSLAQDMIHSMPGTGNPARGDEVKTAAERQQEAALQWSNRQMDHPGRR